MRRWLNTDPARTGGRAEPLSLEEAEDWSDGGLWPRPKDLG
jgi:acyl-CoA dehydrogenase